MPFGCNGAPANFAIVADAISTTNSRLGIVDPDWYTPTPFLFLLYVGDGVMFDIKNAGRQKSNADTWEWIARGLLGMSAINDGKLDLEGQRGPFAHWSVLSSILNTELYSYAMRRLQGACSPRSVFSVMPLACH